jgi:hypothetical protein
VGAFSSRGMNDQALLPIADDRKLSVIFVHSELDDLGLSAAEFRVYAHLVRRSGKGDAFPGLDSVAKVCRMNRKSVRSAIKNLVAYNLIQKTDRPGHSPLYKLTPNSDWKTSLIPPPKDRSKRDPSQKRPIPNKVHHPSQTRSTTPPKQGPPPLPNKVHEGNTLKDIPLRISTEGSSPRIREEHEIFIEQWHDSYLEHFGRKYVFAGGKDGKAVKVLLKAKIPVASLIETALKAWELQGRDKWLADWATTIAGFASKINEILIKTSAADLIPMEPGNRRLVGL